MGRRRWRSSCIALGFKLAFWLFSFLFHHLCPPHWVFGLSIARLVAWLNGLENIGGINRGFNCRCLKIFHIWRGFMKRQLFQLKFVSTLLCSHLLPFVRVLKSYFSYWFMAVSLPLPWKICFEGWTAALFFLAGFVIFSYLWRSCPSAFQPQAKQALAQTSGCGGSGIKTAADTTLSVPPSQGSPRAAQSWLHKNCASFSCAREKGEGGIDLSSLTSRCRATLDSLKVLHQSIFVCSTPKGT